MKNEANPNNLKELFSRLLKIEPQVDRLIDLLKSFATQLPNSSGRKARNNDTPGQYIDSEEVMMRLKISKRTLQRLRKTHVLQYYQPSGNKCLYLLDDVIAYHEKIWTRPHIPELENNPYLKT